MRLTKKCRKHYITNSEIINEQIFTNMFDKLGQLEDIEEELGIDLVALFKAMKTEVPLYYIDEDNIIEFKCFCDEYSYHCKRMDLEYEAIGIYTDVCHLEKYLYFKDYGKTWALTKEELL